MSNFLIACGGTGGHLSPGIALAQCLNARGHVSSLLISRKDVDSKLVEAYSQLEFLRSPGAAFSWKPLKFLKFNWQQFRALRYAMKLIADKRPDAVIGFGGFLSVGLVMAGFLKGIPVVLHEANRNPGRAIRMLSGFARRVYLPEGVRIRKLAPSTVKFAGYPVREDIQVHSRELARKRLGIDVTGKLVLVLGGSQGALALNRWVKEHFVSLAKEGINVLCVTGLLKQGREHLEHTNEDGETYRAYLMPFTTEMADVLSCADLVVSRAGAGSIAEFMRCRLPSILVPYPYAADDHQMANARYFEQRGGCIVVSQDNVETLANEVNQLIYNDWLLAKFKTNLEQLDRNNSIHEIADDLEFVVEEYRREIAWQ